MFEELREKLSEMKGVICLVPVRVRGGIDRTRTGGKRA